eukprot:gnl/MRDRNA2_/MRDRNA2_78326_c0_seq1.p1 gnl/MRDRNA2_/MRDRNA2_78326_c0~~gnl/MRDRNA2_/MRDRNA2_78326_c0_seq1.p1  ORF type:complete len:976 (+),score=263.94 gnl/MRDRNA2_/MRDRNA2_78326_c0_seq1:388-2928(+)
MLAHFNFNDTVAAGGTDLQVDPAQTQHMQESQTSGESAGVSSSQEKCQDLKFQELRADFAKCEAMVKEQVCQLRSEMVAISSIGSSNEREGRPANSSIQASPAVEPQVCSDISAQLMQAKLDLEGCQERKFQELQSSFIQCEEIVQEQVRHLHSEFAHASSCPATKQGTSLQAEEVQGSQESQGTSAQVEVKSDIANYNAVAEVEMGSLRASICRSEEMVQAQLSELHTEFSTSGQSPVTTAELENLGGRLLRCEELLSQLQNDIGSCREEPISANDLQDRFAQLIQAKADMENRQAAAEAELQNLKDELWQCQKTATTQSNKVDGGVVTSLTSDEEITTDNEGLSQFHGLQQDMAAYQVNFQSQIEDLHGQVSRCEEACMQRVSATYNEIQASLQSLPGTHQDRSTLHVEPSQVDASKENEEVYLELKSTIEKLQNSTDRRFVDLSSHVERLQTEACEFQKAPAASGGASNAAPVAVSHDPHRSELASQPLESAEVVEKFQAAMEAKLMDLAAKITHCESVSACATSSSEELPVASAQDPQEMTSPQDLTETIAELKNKIHSCEERLEQQVHYHEEMAIKTEQPVLSAEAPGETHAVQTLITELSDSLAAETKAREKADGKLEYMLSNHVHPHPVQFDEVASMARSEAESAVAGALAALDDAVAKMMSLPPAVMAAAEQAAAAEVEPLRSELEDAMTRMSHEDSADVMVAAEHAAAASVSPLRSELEAFMAQMSNKGISSDQSVEVMQTLESRLDAALVSLEDRDGTITSLVNRVDSISESMGEISRLICTNDEVEESLPEHRDGDVKPGGQPQDYIEASPPAKDDELDEDNKDFSSGEAAPSVS